MKVLLIDFYNLIHRARHGFGEFSAHSMTFNSLRMLKSEVKNHKPDVTYIVLEGRPKHRTDLSVAYKANRIPVRDAGFYSQKEEILKCCKMLPNIQIAQHPTCEADDVIAHLATKAHCDDKIVIVSSDSDFLQIVTEDDRIMLWNPVKKSWCAHVGYDYLKWKSLAGDSTDNIQGVKGIGAMRATTLAKNPEMMTEFLLNKEKQSQYELAYSLIEFKSIDKDDTDLCFTKSVYDENGLAEFFEFAEFKSLSDKVALKKFVSPFANE